MSDRSQLVSEIRRFNRFYTRTLGLLEETLNDTDFTLTEAPVFAATRIFFSASLQVDQPTFDNE